MTQTKRTNNPYAYAIIIAIIIMLYAIYMLASSCYDLGYIRAKKKYDIYKLK